MSHGRELVIERFFWQCGTDSDQKTNPESNALAPARIRIHTRIPKIVLYKRQPISDLVNRPVVPCHQSHPCGAPAPPGPGPAQPKMAGAPFASNSNALPPPRSTRTTHSAPELSSSSPRWGSYGCPLLCYGVYSLSPKGCYCWQSLRRRLEPLLPSFPAAFRSGVCCV